MVVAKGKGRWKKEESKRNYDAVDKPIQNDIEKKNR